MYFYYLPEACRGADRGDISDKVACNFRRTLTSRRKKSHRITPQLSSARGIFIRLYEEWFVPHAGRVYLQSFTLLFH